MFDGSWSDTFDGWHITARALRSTIMTRAFDGARGWSWPPVGPVLRDCGAFASCAAFVCALCLWMGAFQSTV